METAGQNKKKKIDYCSTNEDEGNRKNKNTKKEKEKKTRERERDCILAKKVGPYPHLGDAKHSQPRGLAV